MAALAFQAFEMILRAPGGDVWAGMAAALSALGVDTAVTAWIRLYQRLEQSGWTKAAWDSPDYWAFNLAGAVAKDSPELSWAFLLGLIAAVPDSLLLHVGAGELEDFCWAASESYIERIEAEAAGDPRFRRALTHVWPGGDQIPSTLYARIRAAVEPLEP